MSFWSLMKVFKVFCFLNPLFSLSPGTWLPDCSLSTFWGWIKIVENPPPHVIHQKLFLDMYIGNMNLILCAPIAKLKVNAEKHAQFHVFYNTVVATMTFSGLKPSYLLKCCSKCKSRNIFGNCASWGFQNTPNILKLIKFWLRYLRSKTNRWNSHEN